MLGGALGRLFVDLDRIPEPERSSYEYALHRELLALAQRFQPLRIAIERGHDFALEVDLKPQGSDITRLRCEKFDCPNKRL